MGHSSNASHHARWQRSTFNLMRSPVGVGVQRDSSHLIQISEIHNVYLNVMFHLQKSQTAPTKVTINVSKHVNRLPEFKINLSIGRIKLV